MSLVRALIVLAVALLLQAGLGKLIPGSHSYVDVLLVPVVIYGLGSSQRAAMLMGCASGLLTDTWFHAGPFGLNGFKRTLLGWLLGAVATRFDLDQPAGRLVVGGLVSIADDGLELVLRGLLDAGAAWPHPGTLLVKAIVSGLLVSFGGAILDRGWRVEQSRRPI